jgi:PAS domain S-box-containing protein
MNPESSTVERKVVAGLVGAFVVAIIMATIQFQALQKFRDHDRLVAHTHEVLLEIVNVASEFERTQSNARYYALTGNSEFLKSYTIARRNALQCLAILRNITKDNLRQQQRIDALDRLASIRLTLVSGLIEYRNKGGSAPPLSSSAGELANASRQMDSIADAMRREERNLLDRRRAKSDAAAFWNVLTLIGGGILSLLLVSGAALLLHRDLSARRLSEVLLRESEERFRLLIESVRDYAILTLDVRGNVTTWNTGAERIIGYRAAEVIGKSFKTFYPSDDIESGKHEHELKAAAEDGKYEEEGWRVRKDGALFWANVVVTAIRDQEGELKGFAKVTRDLSQRRRADDALAEQGHRLREQADLLELTQDAILVREIGGRILFWNRGAENLYGWPRDKAVGQLSHVLLQTKFPKPVEEIDAELFETKYWEGELVHGKRDGSRISVASRWALREPKERGTPHSVLEINTNVTERRLAAEALQRSEEQTRLLLNSIAEAIYGMDLDGNCTFCNPSCLRLLRYDEPEQLLGKNMHALSHYSRADGAPYPNEECSISRVLHDGKEAHSEDEVLWRGDGTSFPAEYWSHPVYRNNQLTGAVVTFIDITSRKQTEESLRRATESAEAANRAKSEFLARMSHEIRTPMNSICGMADLLWDTQLSSEQREYVRVFRTSAEHLLQLINDILDLSRIEAGGFGLETTRFDVVQTVEECLELLAVRAHQKGLELNFDLTDNVPAVMMGDPSRLQQILINLVGNAIKFTEKGEVLVRVELENEASGKARLHFSVCDTGQGILPSHQEIIFDPFTQADSSITRRFGGTGLGLAITKHLVGLMGGRIWVNSEVGVGSTFHFVVELPVCETPEPAVSQAIQSLKDLKALIVDDNATNRIILRETLRRWGITADEASNGIEGLEMLARASQINAQYDLVLLDGRMPGLSGMEVASQIQKSAASGRPVILLLASDLQAGDAAKLREIGVEIFLTKPIKRLKLLDAILRSAGVRPSERTSDHLYSLATSNPEMRQRGRILVAEDSPDNLYLIQAYLKDTLYEIEPAKNGEVARQKAITRGYDLILMDAQMPVMDGYSATRAIRMWETEHHLPPTPIIALTAHALAGEAERSLEAGCTAYLSKPVAKSVLLETIGRYIFRNSSTESQNEKIKEKIPPGLESLVPEYLERRAQDIQRLMTALAAQDFETLRITGHNMKGTGLSYGFAKITEAGASIELAAKSQDQEELQRQIELLSAYLDRVEIERG